MVNPKKGWETVGPTQKKDGAGKGRGTRGRTLPMRRTRGSRGKGKGGAKTNLKDPPPTSKARRPDKKEGEDNEATSSEEDIPQTPVKDNLKDDKKYDENFETPPPTSKNEGHSDLTKLQDSGQLEASMDELFTDDIMLSPRAASRMKIGRAHV